MFAMAKRRNFTQGDFFWCMYILIFARYYNKISFVNLEEKILSNTMRLLQELDSESLTLQGKELAFWNKCKEEYLTPEISEHQTVS